MKYPVSTGGNASGKVVITSTIRIIFLYFSTNKDRITDERKLISVDKIVILRVVKIIPIISIYLTINPNSLKLF